MDWCTQKAEKNTCRIVMTNDLRRKEFLDVLKQLQPRDPQAQQDPPPGDRIQSIDIQSS